MGFWARESPLRRLEQTGLELMRIRKISAYRVELPLKEGRYAWSGGKSVDVFDSTIVRVETDEGLVGTGEVCPLGPAYLPAFAAGARAGIAELAPGLIGEDPRQLDRLNRKMDAALKGHPYAKSALDVACWDLLGQAAGLPVSHLLGGRYEDDFVLYRAISQDRPEAMAERVSAYREEGYRRFQLKVGGDPDDDIARIRAVSAVLQSGDRLVADANTGWRMFDAVRVVRAVREVDVAIEQPCLSYEECLAVRRNTDHPFVLDECIDGVDALLRAASRPRDGCGQPEDQQARRTDTGEADARPVRVDGRGDDDRGHLGRRHRHGRDRASGPQHASGISLHVDGLQQLRHRLDGRGRSPAKGGADGCVDRTGAGGQAPDGRSGQAGP